MSSFPVGAIELKVSVFAVIALQSSGFDDASESSLAFVCPGCEGFELGVGFQGSGCKKDLGLRSWGLEVRWSNAFLCGGEFCSGRVSEGRCATEEVSHGGDFLPALRPR